MIYTIILPGVIASVFMFFFGYWIAWRLYAKEDQDVPEEDDNDTKS